MGNPLARIAILRPIGAEIGTDLLTGRRAPSGEISLGKHNYNPGHLILPLTPLGTTS